MKVPVQPLGILQCNEVTEKHLRSFTKLRTDLTLATPGCSGGTQGGGIAQTPSKTREDAADPAPALPSSAPQLSNSGLAMEEPYTRKMYLV